MAIDSRTVSEREQTDASLRTEREQLDRALVEHVSAREDEAAGIVLLARESADAVLMVARDKADRLLSETTESEVPSAVLVEERVMDDQALRQQRASEDVALRRAREASARLLLCLSPIERDKTDHDLLNERARSDDALSIRDDFLGVVSHDLRNWLCGVVMSASLISERTPPNDAGKGVLQEVENIINCASRMNRLIADLIDIVSIDAGKLAMVAVGGDLTSVIVEVCDMFRATAASKGILLHVELDQAPLHALFDHGRMLQVLTNLITNAIKFSPSGSTIEVRGAVVSDGLLVSVSDDGLGVPSHMLETIFERFAQVATSDRRGTGLGLHICRCIVEAHGGRIYAESPQLRGSRFCFWLPLAARFPLAGTQHAYSPQ